PDGRHKSISEFLLLAPRGSPVPARRLCPCSVHSTRSTKFKLRHYLGATSAATVSDRASDGCCECCVGSRQNGAERECHCAGTRQDCGEDVDLLEKGLGCTLPE